MRPLHAILIAILGLGLAGVRGYGAEVKTEAEQQEEADTFVNQYETWMGHFKDDLRTLVGEVVEKTGCDELTSKALEKGAEPIGTHIVDHWRKFWRAFYFENHNDLMGASYGDNYSVLLATDPMRKSQADLTSQWDRLLASTLSTEQQARWQAELNKRIADREKVFKDWLKAASENLEKSLRTSYQRRIDVWVEKAALAPAKSELLKPVIDAAVKGNLAASQDYFETNFAQQCRDFLSLRSKAISDLGKDKKVSFVPVAGLKAGRGLFEEGLRKTASSDEMARIKKLDDELEVRVHKIAVDMADRVLSRQAAERQAAQQGRLAALISAAGLDEKRRAALEDKLKEAGKEVDEQWTRSFIITATTQVRRLMEGAMNPEESLARMEQGRIGFSDPKADAVAAEARRKAWDDTVTTSITHDEKARWEEAARREAGARVLMMTHMAVAEADRLLFLQPDQRAKLELLVREAAKPLGSYQPSQQDWWQENLDGALVLLPALDRQAVDALLDETQKKTYADLLKRWQPYWQQLKPRLRERP